MANHRLALATAALAAAALAGCQNRRAGAPYTLPSVGPDAVPVGALSLDRGGWVVGQQTGLKEVLVPGDLPGSAPKRLGFVTTRSHRQVRGGPAFTVHEVSRVDRDDVVGIVDALGNAKRFRPQRDGRIEVEPAGNNTLERSVQAIFETTQPITLVATSERRLAFETLDRDRNGTLDADEYPRIKAKRGSPDTNRDGVVDWNEFDADDDL